MVDGSQIRLREKIMFRSLAEETILESGRVFAEYQTIREAFSISKLLTAVSEFTVKWIFLFV